MAFEWFWQHVLADGTGCFVWHGPRLPSGYGKSRRDGQQYYAHRFSWALRNGPIPYGLLICHHCDNPPCVNPDHLFISDYAGNMADMIKKGRQRRKGPTGEQNRHAKLNPTKVMDILQDPRQLQPIADDYGVTKQAIWAIKHHRSWKHITKGTTNGL